MPHQVCNGGALPTGLWFADSCLTWAVLASSLCFSQVPQGAPRCTRAPSHFSKPQPFLFFLPRGASRSVVPFSRLGRTRGEQTGGPAECRARAQPALSPPRPCSPHQDHCPFNTFFSAVKWSCGRQLSRNCVQVHGL